MVRHLVIVLAIVLPVLTIALPIRGIRRNIATMPAKELQAYRDAIRAAQANPDAFPRIAGWHGLPSNLIPDMAGCPHGSDYFLVWHRVFLRKMEEAIGYSIPYYEWKKSVPSAFTDTTYVDGSGVTQPNPLYSSKLPIEAPIDPSHPDGLTYRSPTDPWPVADMTDAENLAVYGSSDFASLTANLEGVHNSAHANSGGVLNNLDLAAFDPLFWGIHCNTDRRFFQWQMMNDAAVAYSETAMGPVKVHDGDYSGTDIINDFSGWTRGTRDPLAAVALWRSQFQALLAKRQAATPAPTTSATTAPTPVPTLAFQVLEVDLVVGMVRSSDVNGDAHADSIKLAPGTIVDRPDPAAIPDTFTLTSGDGDNMAQIILQGDGLPTTAPTTAPKAAESSSSNDDSDETSTSSSGSRSKYGNDLKSNSASSSSSSESSSSSSESTWAPSQWRPNFHSPKEVFTRTSVRLPGQKSPAALTVMMAPDTTVNTKDYKITNGGGNAPAPVAYVHTENPRKPQAPSYQLPTPTEAPTPAPTTEETPTPAPTTPAPLPATSAPTPSPTPLLRDSTPPVEMLFPRSEVPPVADHSVLTIYAVESTKDSHVIEVVAHGRRIATVHLLGLAGMASMTSYMQTHKVDVSRAKETLFPNESLASIHTNITYRYTNSVTHEVEQAPLWRSKLETLCY